MGILHIDTEMGWRGGENQLRLLLEGLAPTDLESHLVARPGSEVQRRLRSIVPTIEIPMRGGLDPLAAFRIARYCRAHGIRLIDAHTANAHTLGLLVKRLLPKIKLVVHRRVDNVPPSHWLNKAKYLSPKVDQFVAISTAIKQVLIDFGVPPHRITVVKSAVPETPYLNLDRAAEKRALAEALGLSPELTLIGNASAFTSQKDYPTLLKALQRLKMRGAPFHAVIAGDGPDRAALEALRIELGLEHHLTFLGFIEKVAPFLSALDILAVPSRNEGLGTILLDGALAGCALVATAVGGIPEIIETEVTGLLCPQGETACLAAALERLVLDAALRLRLSAAARTYVQREFSVPAMVGGNRSIYLELLADKSRSSKF